MSLFGTNTEDDYGVNLDTALEKIGANVGIGSNAITQGADNSGNTVWNDGYNSNPLYDDYGKTAGSSTLYGTTADNYNNAGSNLTTGLAGLNKFVNDNKALIGLAGAGSALLSGSGAQKTGYQGSIPELMAGRTMVTKPPTRAQGYRPGAGGIDYGGDVSYVRTPGIDPWAYLSGKSGSSAGADLTGLPADVATAVNNAITGVTGGGFGTGKTTVTGGGGNDKITTVTGGTGNDKITTTTLTDAQKDALAVDNWRKSVTPQQYLTSINQWIASNPNMTKAELDAAMTRFKVTQTDLQNALGSNKTLSAADIYALTHGQGLKEANAQQTAGIAKWIQDNPYATSTQIKEAIKGSGVNVADINEALAGTKTSGAVQKALTESTGLDQLYKDILNYQASGATPAQIAAAKTQFKVSDADIAAATKYSTDTGYKGIDVVAANKAAAAEQIRLNNIAAAEQTRLNNAASAEQIRLNNATNTTLQAVNERDWAAQQAENERQWAAQQAANAAANQPVQQPVQQPVEQPVVQNTASTASNKNNEIYQFFANPETQAALASNPRSVAETMQALGYSPAEVAQATGTNVADVQAAYDAALASETYYGYAGGGEIAMAKGRYLQGGTDGMADELPAQIGEDQPAALSHGEFVIPADVVSHMGNGNSDAGAKKLYQMMDKIRMARTGNKKQGKKINPDKFMPGGLASAYANGGSVKHFVGGGPTAPAGTMGVESNLSNWVGPYVTNMLGQGQALANMPYQAYMGPLTAGQSSVQNQGFNAAAGLTMPSSLTSAAQTAGSVASAVEGLPAYDSTTFGNQYTAPTAGTPTTFTNQYTAPGAYSPTTSSFDSAQAKAYMNPYLEQSLAPQLEEARRQSLITQQQNDTRMTQGGAFGGGRNAIMNAETQRNLGTNLANITGQGYNTAYTNAMNQFNVDQQRKMQDAQFGAQQGMTAAQLKAQFGLSEQQANEAARQFGAQQSMTGAQLGAQYGLAGQQATEQSKQYGAGYGLQGLNTGLQAAQTQGALGTQINQAGLGNLNAQLAAGAQQRGIESEGIAADKAQFEEARANPYKMIQYQQSLLQGLPLAAQSYQGIEPTALVKAAQGATTVNGLLKALGLID